MIQSSETIDHATLAEAYRRTRGRYPSEDGILTYLELAALYQNDERMPPVVEQLTYEDIEHLLPE